MDTLNQPIGLLDDSFAESLGVLEDAADGFAACDSAFRLVFLNSAAERLYGKSKPELIGTTPWRWSSDLGGRDLELESRRVMAERVPAAFDIHHRSLALCLDISVSPAAGAVSRSGSGTLPNASAPRRSYASLTRNFPPFTRTPRWYSSWWMKISVCAR
jgi:PAS domain S-box